MCMQIASEAKDLWYHTDACFYVLLSQIIINHSISANLARNNMIWAETMGCKHSTVFKLRTIKCSHMRDVKNMSTNQYT